MIRVPTHLIAALVALFAATFLIAQTPTKPVAPAAEVPQNTKELRGPNEQNAKLFLELTQGLLTLAQRLEKSDRPEDKERAKTIYAALEHSQKASIGTQFKTLIAGLNKGSDNPQDISNVKGQNAELAKAILEMITILQTDDDSERLKKEIASLEKFLKEAVEIKRRTEANRQMTEAGKGEAGKQAKTQADLAEQTKDLGDRMSGKKGDGDKGGPKEDPKATPKGEPKSGENAAEPKADSKDAKADSKDGEPKDSSDGKPGGKDGKPNDGAAEAKKAPEGKEGDMGDAKGSGEPKPSEPKASEPKDNKPASSKDMGQGKGDAKPSKGQPQAGEAKGKGGEAKEQQAQSKGAGQPPPPGQEGQPGQQAQPQNQTPGRKQIAEAYPNQKNAEDELKKPDRDKAAKQQDQAIEKIAKAIEELKKKLKQLREEEMLKTLAALEARCNRMLFMQIEVYEGTKLVHSNVVKNKNEKSTADIQKSQQLGDKEGNIVAEAEKAMKLLESEGSAVAFASVLEEVKGDMQAVQKRLGASRVDTDTQEIEENIIAMLKDMLAALKKAQQDIQNQQGQPPPGGGKPGNKALIDQLAELKLIRAFQTQINSRTKMYATKYSGEQAADPLIQGELRQLSGRQAKLQDMVHKIATGANQ